eukprot:gene26544-32080_t
MPTTVAVIQNYSSQASVSPAAVCPLKGRRLDCMVAWKRTKRIPGSPADVKELQVLTAGKFVHPEEAALTNFNEDMHFSSSFTRNVVEKNPAIWNCKDCHDTNFPDRYTGKYSMADPTHELKREGDDIIDVKVLIDLENGVSNITAVFSNHQTPSHAHSVPLPSSSSSPVQTSIYVTSPTYVLMTVLVGLVGGWVMWFVYGRGKRAVETKMQQEVSTEGLEVVQEVILAEEEEEEEEEEQAEEVVDTVDNTADFSEAAEATEVVVSSEKSLEAIETAAPAAVPTPIPTPSSTPSRASKPPAQLLLTLSPSRFLKHSSSPYAANNTSGAAMHSVTSSARKRRKRKERRVLENGKEEEEEALDMCVIYGGTNAKAKASAAARGVGVGVGVGVAEGLGGQRKPPSPLAEILAQVEAAEVHDEEEEEEEEEGEGARPHALPSPLTPLSATSSSLYNLPPSPSTTRSVAHTQTPSQSAALSLGTSQAFSPSPGPAQASAEDAEDAEDEGSAQSDKSPLWAWFSAPFFPEAWDNPPTSANSQAQAQGESCGEVELSLALIYPPQDPPAALAREEDQPSQGSQQQQQGEGEGEGEREAEDEGEAAGALQLSDLSSEDGGGADSDNVETEAEGPAALAHLPAAAPRDDAL